MAKKVISDWLTQNLNNFASANNQISYSFWPDTYIRLRRIFIQGYVVDLADLSYHLPVFFTFALSAGSKLIMGVDQLPNYQVTVGAPVLGNQNFNLIVNPTSPGVNLDLLLAPIQHTVSINCRLDSTIVNPQYNYCHNFEWQYTD